MEPRLKPQTMWLWYYKPKYPIVFVGKVTRFNLHIYPCTSKKRKKKKKIYIIITCLVNHDLHATRFCWSQRIKVEWKSIWKFLDLFKRNQKDLHKTKSICQMVKLVCWIDVTLHSYEQLYIGVNPPPKRQEVCWVFSMERSVNFNGKFVEIPK